MDKSSDFSFVLERKVAPPGQSQNQNACGAGKISLFSGALLMCVACLSNFMALGTGAPGTKVSGSGSALNPGIMPQRGMKEIVDE